MKTVKKRNPQDLTLRNLRALKKRIELIEVKMTLLEVMFFDKKGIKKGKK